MTITEIDNFVHEHIQQEIEVDGLTAKGFNMNNTEIFETQLDMYMKGLAEGIVNGIYMMGGEVEDLEFRDSLDS